MAAGVFVIGVAVSSIFDAAVARQLDAVESEYEQSRSAARRTASAPSFDKVRQAAAVYDSAIARVVYNTRMAIAAMALVLLAGAAGVGYLEGWEPAESLHGCLFD